MVVPRFPRVLAPLAAALLFAFASWLIVTPSEAAALPADTATTVPVQLNGTVKIEVDSLQARASAVRDEIEDLDILLEQRSEAYNQIAVKLDESNVRLSELRNELAQAEKERDYRVKKLEARIRALYMSGGRDQLLQLLMLSEGFDDFLSRVRVIATLADQDTDLLDNLAKSKTRVGQVLADIDRQKREELALRRQLSEERTKIQEQLAARLGTLNGIDSEIATIIEQERQRQIEEQERLRQAIAALVNGWQVYPDTLPQTPSEVLNQFLETAAFYQGVPYVWAGDRPSTGLDCSGFTRYVFAQHGVNLPHYSGYQAQMGIPVEPQDIQPGDLLAFGFPVHHVGIYMGEGLYIHAPRTGDVVKISHLAERRNLTAIRRFNIQPRIGPPSVG